tara:strand:+ start:8370 stop:8696 length:327 start_codon:yes stop_codon:yes gene_type:complete
MAFGNHYPNSVSVTGFLTQVEDMGPTNSSVKKCGFTMRNPSLSKPEFDTYVYGYAYGMNASNMLRRVGDLSCIEGRIGSSRGKNIVLVDKFFSLDETHQYAEEQTTKE